MAAAHPVLTSEPSLGWFLKLRSYLLSDVRNSEAATSMPIFTLPEYPAACDQGRGIGRGPNPPKRQFHACLSEHSMRRESGTAANVAVNRIGEGA